MLVTLRLKGGRGGGSQFFQGGGGPGGGMKFQFGGGGFPGGGGGGRAGRSPQGRKELFKDTPGVKELSTKSWKEDMEESASRRNIVVLFYESDLGEMEELREAFTTFVSKLVQGSALVEAGAVNCGRYEGLCHKQGARKLPFVKYYGPEGQQPSKPLVTARHLQSLPPAASSRLFAWFHPGNLLTLSAPPLRTHPSVLSFLAMAEIVDIEDRSLHEIRYDELKKEIRTYLLGKDLSSISLKALRVELETRLDLPTGGLNERKGEIRSIAEDLVTEAQNAAPLLPPVVQDRTPT
eukprot:s1464_g1.t1